MVQKRLSEAAKKRLRAGRLLLSGRNCAEVAVATGVARQTVYTWKRLLDEGGALGALHARVGVAQLPLDLAAHSSVPTDSATSKRRQAFDPHRTLFGRDCQGCHGNIHTTPRSNDPNAPMSDGIESKPQVWTMRGLHGVRTADDPSAAVRTSQPS